MSALVSAIVLTDSVDQDFDTLPVCEGLSSRAAVSSCCMYVVTRHSAHWAGTRGNAFAHMYELLIPRGLRPSAASCKAVVTVFCYEFKCLNGDSPGRWPGIELLQTRSRLRWD